MRQKRLAQRSLFESDFVDHEIGRELAGMSRWLDEHPELLDLVARDIDPQGVSRFGRQGLTHEVILRCAILKQYRQVGYRELEFHLRDSRSLQRFARVDPLRVPGKSALQAAIGTIRAPTWQKLNDVLLRDARVAKIERGDQIRLDSTVTETHILEPTDSRLLFDGVRVMVRLLKEARDELGIRIVFHSHWRLAKRRARAIWSARRAEQRVTLYRDLLAAVRSTLDYVRVARTAVESCRQPWSIRWLSEEKHYRALIDKVIDQSERRVFNGETVPAREKVVSLFEPHTDIIQKGGREVYYGHKVTLSTGRSGLVLDAVIEDGNPPDSKCCIPMLERHVARYGSVPVSMACDGGYADKANLAAAKALGVVNAVFHKKKGLEVKAMATSQWLYNKLKCFRAGIEAGISYLKRCFGLDRCNWKGLGHFTSYVWSSLFTHNLLVLGRLRPKPS